MYDQREKDIYRFPPSPSMTGQTWREAYFEELRRCDYLRAEKDARIRELVDTIGNLKNVLLGDEEQLKRVVDQNAALRDALVMEHQAGELREQDLQAKLSASEARVKGYEAEKFRRIYYQGIVYTVCIWIDQVMEKKPGGGVVCGTYETPSEEVEEALECIGANLKALRVIKGVNDFTEEEEKELDTLRAEVERLHRHDCASAIEEARCQITALKQVNKELEMQLELSQGNLKRIGLDAVEHHSAAIKWYEEAQRLETQLCLAREFILKYLPTRDAPPLSMPAPCPHAERNAALEKVVEAAGTIINSLGTVVTHHTGSPCASIIGKHSWEITRMFEDYRAALDAAKEGG